MLKYPQNFTGLGQLKHHQIKLHTDPNVKPINVPPRSIPYNLQDREQKVIEDMIKQGVSEEHPTYEPAPWV